VLTPATNERISRIGIETMVAETCYPVKVAHGHAKELMGKTSYLFLPTLIDMATPEPSERGYYCPMVQSSSYMIRAALGIPESTLLSPALNLKSDPEMVALDIYKQLGAKVGWKRGQVKAAFQYALERQEQFERELHQRGRDVIKSLEPDEPLVVVTGRPYNLHDERLNLRLGQNLAKIGVRALPMDFMDLCDADLTGFSSMFWGLGAQILRAATQIRNASTHFGLHVTNFSCGADSFIEHFYKHIMGDKPYMILEMDEHSAVAGVMTRLEAYKNVIENSVRKLEPGLSRRVAN
jgi:predicted nucleotide-binding protein (sugar kinase/HSP70/actin superfamily)